MEPQTVFCIIEPDEIFCFWKADLSYHVSVYQQAAEGADIVFKRSFGILFFLYRLIKHQSWTLDEASVSSVNGPGSSYSAGISQVVCF